VNPSQIPHLLPLFHSLGWKCLEWTPNMIKGKLTDEMRATASLIDGVKKLSDLAALGVDMRVVNQLIEQDVVALVPGRVTSHRVKPPTERWSVISPHSDDAALSIGGTLAGLADSVEISLLTMIGPSRCAGTCAPLYGDIETVTHIRTKEDDLYGEFIGAKVECANIQDVEMYVDTNGSRWAERIMETPDDVRLKLYVSGLKTYFETHRPDVILAPLAVGAHGDHAATHLALWSLLPELLKKAPATRVLFYEDLPYCQYDQPALVKRLKDFNHLKPVTITIDATQKAKGVSIYRSQYVAADIAWDILEYAEKLSTKEGVYVERLWELSDTHFK
jgi:LmbE family N-acetylglucosaminyl deacetylase